MYIYQPVHYLICFVCFLDVVLLVTCRKFTKQTNYAQEWVEWYKMTVSGFTSELFTLENTGGALQVKGFWYMLRFMYFEVDYLILSLFQGKISEVKQRNLNNISSLKGHVNPKIHVFLILCKKWRRERIWNSFCPIRLILGENRHFQLKFHFR